MPDQEITDRGVIMERGVIIAMIRNNPFNLEHTARLTTWVEDEIIKTRAMLVRTDGRLTILIALNIARTEKSGARCAGKQMCVSRCAVSGR